MQAVEVKNLLEAKLPDTVVEVEGEGCNFQLNLISDELAALSPVKRQQQIYALAACALQSMGYLNVQSIAGGFDAWVAAGKSVAQPEQPSFE